MNHDVILLNKCAAALYYYCSSVTINKSNDCFQFFEHPMYYIYNNI